jgi:chaperonin GroEL (HSP60 family)
MSYFSYEVITTSRTVFVFPMVFPKVTLCNLNLYTSEYAVEFLRKINKNLMTNLDVFDKNQMSNISYENTSKLITDIFAQAFLQMNSLNFSDLGEEKTRTRFR